MNHDAKPNSKQVSSSQGLPLEIWNKDSRASTAVTNDSDVDPPLLNSNSKSKSKYASKKQVGTNFIAASIVSSNYSQKYDWMPRFYFLGNHANRRLPPISILSLSNNQAGDENIVNKKKQNSKEIQWDAVDPEPHFQGTPTSKKSKSKLNLKPSLPEGKENGSADLKEAETFLTTPSIRTGFENDYAVDSVFYDYDGCHSVDAVKTSSSAEAQLHSVDAVRRSPSDESPGCHGVDAVDRSLSVESAGSHSVDTTERSRSVDTVVHVNSEIFSDSADAPSSSTDAPATAERDWEPHEAEHLLSEIYDLGDACICSMEDGCICALEERFCSDDEHIRQEFTKKRSPNSMSIKSPKLDQNKQEIPPETTANFSKRSGIKTEPKSPDFQYHLPSKLSEVDQILGPKCVRRKNNKLSERVICKKRFSPYVYDTEVDPGRSERGEMNAFCVHQVGLKERSRKSKLANAKSDSNASRFKMEDKGYQMTEYDGIDFQLAASSSVDVNTSSAVDTIFTSKFSAASSEVNSESKKTFVTNSEKMTEFQLLTNSSDVDPELALNIPHAETKNSANPTARDAEISLMNFSTLNAKAVQNDPAEDQNKCKYYENKKTPVSSDYNVMTVQNSWTGDNSAISEKENGHCAGKLTVEAAIRSRRMASSAQFQKSIKKKASLQICELVKDFEQADAFLADAEESEGSDGEPTLSLMESEAPQSLAHAATDSSLSTRSPPPRKCHSNPDNAQDEKQMTSPRYESTTDNMTFIASFPGIRATTSKIRVSRIPKRIAVKFGEKNDGETVSLPSGKTLTLEKDNTLQWTGNVQETYCKPYVPQVITFYKHRDAKLITTIPSPSAPRPRPNVNSSISKLPPWNSSTVIERPKNFQKPTPQNSRHHCGLQCNTVASKSESSKLGSVGLTSRQERSVGKTITEQSISAINEGKSSTHFPKSAACGSMPSFLAGEIAKPAFVPAGTCPVAIDRRRKLMPARNTARSHPDLQVPGCQVEVPVIYPSSRSETSAERSFSQREEKRLDEDSSAGEWPQRSASLSDNNLSCPQLIPVSAVNDNSNSACSCQGNRHSSAFSSENDPNRFCGGLKFPKRIRFDLSSHWCSSESEVKNGCAATTQRLSKMSRPIKSFQCSADLTRMRSRIPLPQRRCPRKTTRSLGIVRSTMSSRLITPLVTFLGSPRHKSSIMAPIHLNAGFPVHKKEHLCKITAIKEREESPNRTVKLEDKHNFEICKNQLKGSLLKHIN